MMTDITARRRRKTWITLRQRSATQGSTPPQASSALRRSATTVALLRSAEDRRIARNPVLCCAHTGLSTFKSFGLAVCKNRTDKSYSLNQKSKIIHQKLI